MTDWLTDTKSDLLRTHSLERPFRCSDEKFGFSWTTNLAVVCFRGLEGRCFYLWAPSSKLWQQKLFSGRVTMKLISVTAIGAFQLPTKDGYQRVIRKKYNKAKFRDISQLFSDLLEIFVIPNNTKIIYLVVFPGGLIVLWICLQDGRYMERGLIRSNIIRHRIEFRLDSLSLSTIIPLTGKLTGLDFNVRLTPLQCYKVGNFLATLVALDFTLVSE